MVDGLGVGYQLQHAVDLCFGELGCHCDGQQLGHTPTLAASFLLKLRCMSHDEDPTRQVPAYGATAQPAIAARMAPHLRLTQIGAACGAVAVIAATAAVVVFPSFGGAGDRSPWAVGALVSAALMLAICVIQVAVWRRAMASWLGKRVTGSAG